MAWNLARIAKVRNLWDFWQNVHLEDLEG